MAHRGRSKRRGGRPGGHQHGPECRHEPTSLPDIGGDPWAGAAIVQGVFDIDAAAARAVGELTVEQVLAALEQNTVPCSCRSWTSPRGR